jgi:hypothetical protein
MGPVAATLASPRRHTEMEASPTSVRTSRQLCPVAIGPEGYEAGELQRTVWTSILRFTFVSQQKETCMSVEKLMLGLVLAAALKSSTAQCFVRQIPEKAHECMNY